MQNRSPKIFLLFSLIIFIILPHTLSVIAQVKQEQNNNTISPLIVQPKIKIYLAHTVIGQGIDTTLLQAHKIKPALHFITMMDNRYELITDSAVAAVKKQADTSMSYLEIGKALDADRIFIVKLEQMYNVIRAEIISANPHKPDTTTSAEGIAVLHFFKKSSGMPVFDPTLVAALQRAFATSENDSLMFMKQPEPYNIKPAPGLVICGIEFANDSNYVNWEVFNNPLLTSYEYSDLIFKEIYKSKDWVVYDIESRDAIYSMFNLFLIENNILPSFNELAALRRFNVLYYIMGKVERNVYGVKMSLTLYKNNRNSSKAIKSVSDTLDKNDTPKAAIIIQQLAKKLIFNIKN